MKALLGILALLMVACAGPRSQSRASDPALLRLSYLENARNLPYLRLDGVELQESSRLGRMSPVVWHYRKEPLGADYFLPIPDSYELQDRLHEVLSGCLEGHGFALRGWPDDPQLTLGVRVRRLVMSSLGGADGERSCELELEFILKETPLGLEITRFEAKGVSRLAGSWTQMGRDGPRWTPGKGEPDPVLEAAREASLDFLEQTREFWSDPSNWEPSVRLSGKAP